MPVKVFPQCVHDKLDSRSDGIEAVVVSMSKVTTGLSPMLLKRHRRFTMRKACVTSVLVKIGADEFAHKVSSEPDGEPIGVANTQMKGIFIG